jgi:hypothetical protein
MTDWTPVTPATLPAPGRPVLAAYRNAEGKWRAVQAVRVAAGDEDGPPGWYELIDDGHAVVWRQLAYAVSHWK